MALPAQAALEDWPALYDVANVADNDTLNVRTAPSAQAEILATIEPDARGIEVVDVNDDQDWGLINVGEQSGWVSLAFMVRVSTYWAGSFPEITSCYGTEPFWNLTVDDTRASFSRPDGATFTGMPMTRHPSANRTDRWAFLAGGATGILRQNRCGDGMSDRTFGLSLDLVLPGSDVVSGCCSITP